MVKFHRKIRRVGYVEGVELGKDLSDVLVLGVLLVSRQIHVLQRRKQLHISACNHCNQLPLLTTSKTKMADPLPVVGSVIYVLGPAINALHVWRGSGTYCWTKDSLHCLTRSIPVGAREGALEVFGRGGIEVQRAGGALESCGYGRIALEVHC